MTATSRMTGTTTGQKRSSALKVARPRGADSSRVDKEESAPEERSPGDNEEPAWTPSERPQKT